jgi:SAM-dependent methyltransferase
VSLHGVRERLKPLVPPRVRRKVNRAAFALVGLALRGDAVRCPCCGRSFRRFIDYPSAYCAGCGAYERHRLLCLYLDPHPELVAGDVLQVGPEATVIARYGGNAESWLSVDLDPAHPLGDQVMDVMDLALEDASFDLVLCAHVIDLVADRDKAVHELHRVTRPGGTALIQSPRRDFPKGPDEYAVQLTAQGFEVTVVRLPEQQDNQLCRRFGLDDEPIFACLRPA